MLRTGFSFTLTPKWRIDGLRLNERAADVVIADQPHAQRNARRFGVPHRGAHAGIGHRHDDVGVDRLLAGQHPAELGPHFVDAPAEDVAVGPGEVHVFEDAVRERRGRKRLDRSHAIAPK